MPKNCPLGKKGSHDCWECIHRTDKGCGIAGLHNSVDDKKEEPTYDLLEIVTELDARERSHNCLYEKFYGVGWDELCDKAVAILQSLKK